MKKTIEIDEDGITWHRRQITYNSKHDANLYLPSTVATFLRNQARFVKITINRDTKTVTLTPELGCTVDGEYL